MAAIINAIAIDPEKITDGEILQQLEAHEDEYQLFMAAGNLRGGEKVLMSWLVYEELAKKRGLVELED